MFETNQTTKQRALRKIQAQINTVAFNSGEYSMENGKFQANLQGQTKIYLTAEDAKIINNKVYTEKSVPGKQRGSSVTRYYILA